MLAKNVNANAFCLVKRGVLEFFASKLAPTRIIWGSEHPLYAQGVAGLAALGVAQAAVHFGVHPKLRGDRQLAADLCAAKTLVD